SNNGIAIFLGKGDGTFETALNAPASVDTSVAVADFNRDGWPDVAATGPGNDFVFILLGKGDGTFAAPFHGFPAGSDPEYVTAGDFNFDGAPDLAVANPASDEVSVLLGKGDGTFGVAGNIQPFTSFPAGNGPSSVTAGDFNRDGFLDLAVSD